MCWGRSSGGSASASDEFDCEVLVGPSVAHQAAGPPTRSSWLRLRLPTSNRRDVSRESSASETLPEGFQQRFPGSSAGCNRCRKAAGFLRSVSLAYRPQNVVVPGAGATPVSAGTKRMFHVNPWGRHGSRRPVMHPCRRQCPLAGASRGAIRRKCRPPIDALRPLHPIALRGAIAWIAPAAAKSWLALQLPTRQPGRQPAVLGCAFGCPPATGFSLAFGCPPATGVVFHVNQEDGAGEWIQPGPLAGCLHFDRGGGFR